jgi:flagellar basal body P-ring protein FlgI
MKPGYVLPRRSFLASLSLALSTLGCNALDVRSQSPEDEVEALGSSVRLIGDYAVPFGMTPIHIESVGLVTGLPGTGSDPPPSPQRAALLAEMQTRGVINPNRLLASLTTELVMVHAVMRPGIQKGDHFDVEIRVPTRSDGEGLRGGWLMETRLKEMAVLGNQIREGTVLGLAQGPVLVDPAAKDNVQRGRGRILGGGIAMTSRELGLVIKGDERSVLTSAQIGQAVNRRFHTFEGGIKQGMAKPKTDEFIELKIHPRYKDNIERYIRVVRSLPLRESPAQQLARLTLLERQLLDPITAATAAVRLEALGKEGIDRLKAGLASKEEEVRFYSAEALAYLDEPSAAAPLGELAHDVPAFRAYALAALSAMDDFAAYEALRDLLSLPSAETRYGAFRALWAMNARDPLVKGEDMHGQFSYHVLDTSGPAMIHVTRSFRPEVVLFGHEQRFTNPISVQAGTEIMINSQGEDRVTVSRFSVNEPDQKRVVSPRVDEVVRAIVDLGGTYPDVVQALQEAKATGSLTSRFEMDAIPQGGRSYLRKSTDEPLPDGDEPTAPEIVVGNPLPELFSTRTPEGKHAKDPPSEGKNEQPDEEKAKPRRSFLSKMVKRDD